MDPKYIHQYFWSMNALASLQSLEIMNIASLQERKIMSAETLATGTEHLLASVEDGVLTLTLNRPEARNAMSREMTGALAEQLADAELNEDVRCVVLTGAGKGFCAGGDVKGMAARGDGLCVLRIVARNRIAVEHLRTTIRGRRLEVTPDWLQIDGKRHVDRIGSGTLIGLEL